jgi:dihydrolipoamide dehydrogenase
VKVGKFPFIGNGKAIALGEAEGFVKTVFDAATGELLGCAYGRRRSHRADPGLCHRAAARDDRSRTDGTVFAHPTLSEMMHESVLGAYGRALHI